MHWLFMARKVHFMRSGRGRATPVSSASADAAADMAASFEHRIDEILAGKLLDAAKDTGASTICLAGGVAAKVLDVIVNGY